MTAVLTGPEGARAGARPRRSKLRPGDVVGVATVGPRTRRMRTAMTALGIAIGIAAVVAVMGISESSKADLIAQLEELGTNRLRVEPGDSFVGGDVTLPDTAARQIRRVPGVDRAAAVSPVDATMRRSEAIPEFETNGITTFAADVELLDVVGATVDSGRWLSAATERLPAVVLGSLTAERLGIGAADGRAVLIGDELFTVVGILHPVPLYDTLDSSAFVGYPVAEELFEAGRAPSTVYVVADEVAVENVQALLPAATNPPSPGEVAVSNPSDALAAREAVDESLTNLLLGLGTVALLVGGIGIANIMVIGVLERRTEIGVRRALGATRGHIRTQFLLEAALLGGLGGALGVVLGAGVTAGYARYSGQVLAIAPASVALGFGSALVIGVLAGLSPAARAARLPPAEAIRPA